MLDSLSLPFVQRGLVEVGLLALAAGLIGTWIVLRGLAFYSHAVGTAAFPGLVVADGLGFAAPLGALGAAAIFAIVLAAIPRRNDDRGSDIALILVGMLAFGVILASDVFHSSAGIESLLFGSLLLVDPGDIALAAAVSLAAVAATAIGGRHWIASGFDADSGHRTPGLELALLVLIAVATAASLSAVGALLVGALFVVPAATTRPWVTTMRAWQIATVALALALGCAGVLISVELNAPPGAAIAVLGGVTFALSAIARSVSARAALTTALVAVAAALTAGCGSAGTDGPTVVATTPIAADIVANVAGGDFDVETILRPNTDPHEYEPRPDDIRRIAGADIVFASGGDVDGWIGNAIEESGSDAELVTLGDSVPVKRGDDPHWWHNPLNVAGVTGLIASRLGAIEPGEREALTRRAIAYSTRVDAVDAGIEACFGRIPAGDPRRIVTDHDAFGYFGDRYGIEIVGAVIPALTTEAQPSAGDLADLRRVIEREQVRTVFPEASVNDKLARSIAAATGAAVSDDLFGDTLGEADSGGETYLRMERANADTIYDGITGREGGCPR